MMILPAESGLDAQRLAKIILGWPDWSEAATLTTPSSIESGTALANLQLDQPTDVAGVTSGALVAKLDRGSAKPWNLLGWLYVSALSGATWRGRAGDSALEADGSHVYDVSGNANHGSFNGGLTYGTDGGLYGRALRLTNPSTGTGQYVEMASSASLTTTGFSYGGWVTTDYLRTQDLLYHLGTANRRFYLFPSSGVLRLAIDGSGGTTAAQPTAAPFALGTRHHVVVTLTSGTGVVDFWIDGSHVGAASPGAIFGSSTGALRLGSQASAGQQACDGLLEDWRVYDYAIDATEIAAWMAGDAPVDSGRKARWRLNGLDTGSLPVWMAPDLSEWPRTHTWAYVPGGMTCRYTRLDVQNASGGVRAGHVVVANAWQPRFNYKFGYKVGYADETDYAHTPRGQTIAQAVPPRRLCEFELEFQDEDDWFLTGDRMDRLRGSGRPTLVILKPQSASWRQEFTSYGYVQPGAQASSPSFRLWSRAYRHEELL